MLKIHLWTLLAAVTAVTFEANALGALGMFEYGSKDTQIFVYAKNGRPTLRITDQRFPAFAECSSGYRSSPSTRVNSANSATLNVRLVVDSNCYSMQQASDGKFHRKVMDQEFDVLTDIMGASDQTTEVAKNFVDNKIRIGIEGYEANYSDDRPSMISRSFSHREAMNGMALIGFETAVEPK